MASPVWLCNDLWTCRTRTSNSFCMSCQQRLDASSGAPIGEEDIPSAPTDHPSPTGKLDGDAGARDFWQHGHIAIFDVHITDTQSRSYWNKDYRKVLVQHRRRRRRTNIFARAWICGRTSPLMSTLPMASQGGRLRMRKCV